MSPWDLLVNLIGWGLVGVFGLMVAMFVGALIFAVVGAVRPKKKVALPPSKIFP